MAGASRAWRESFRKYDFESSVSCSQVYLARSKALYGGRFLAEKAVEEEVGSHRPILNNDMIGNIEGVDGVIDNRTFQDIL